MTTEERLAKVERELERVKRRSRWLLIGLALGLGALALVWALCAGVLSAQAAPSAQEQQPGTNYNWLIWLITMVLIFGAFYLLAWRPWKRENLRQQERHEGKVMIKLKCPICGEVMSAPVEPAWTMRYRVKVGQTATCQSCGKVSLVGIPYFGGWLLLPALGLALGLLANIVNLLTAVDDYGLAVLFAPFGALYIGFIVFWVYVAVVFFMMKPYAPKLVIALMVADLVFAFVIVAAVRAAVGSGAEFAKAAVAAVVWIPYFLTSKRVMATFGRRGVARPIPKKDLFVSQGGGSATTAAKIETKADEGNTR